MENNENNITNEVITNEEKESKKKKRRLSLIIILILLIILVLASVYFIKFKDKDKSETIEGQSNNKYSSYRLSSNSLEDFDLYFLQLENDSKNKIYSPLSIKYALEMLEEGANGETKKQISNIIGTYSSKKYINSANISLANALFVKNSFKNSIKESYVNTLSTKYNASVVYDDFKTPNVLNYWVSNKTNKLIDGIVSDITNQDFILANALAIDMGWVNKIQSEDKGYIVKYDHEGYDKAVRSLIITDYHGLDFNGFSKKAKSVEIAAVINKYDIVNTLGEDKIRETVGTEYKKWLADGAIHACGNIEDELSVEAYLDKYIKEINAGYKDISSSTDFYFYTDDSVKVFAKDLKEYDGVTLQYVGIMPKNDNLDDYIKNIKASDVNTLIDNLKSIELDNFKDGVITEISGYIPMFKFDYELKLMSDLNKLGITNVFDSKKADLSNLSSDNIFINQATHKTNIEFSNDGIKAASAISLGGAGAGKCGFDYLYEVPVEKIDLTFDSPYMFIIRDKKTKEVWFVGTVYEPIEFQKSINQ